MKKIFSLLVIITGLVTAAVAQKTTFQVSAGVSHASNFIRVKNDIGKWEKVDGLSAKNGFTGGISVRIPFSKYFSFQPGINYLEKGLKHKDSGSNTLLALNYIEIPLTLLFKTNNRETDKKADDFIFGIGPALAFGTSGTITEKTDYDTQKEKVKFGKSDDDNLQGIDIGANVMMGCQFSNNLFFSINYTIGLSNLGIYKDIKWRNNYLGFRVGYSFGGAKK